MTAASQGREGSWGELRRTGGVETVAVQTSFPLMASQVSFGRVASKANEAFYVLPVPYLSSVHFSLAVEEDDEGSPRYLLRSLGRNGTYVNSTLVPINASIAIMSGDVVNILFKGEEKLRFQFISSGGSSQAPSLEAMETDATQEQADEVYRARIRDLEEENDLLKLNNTTHQQRIDAMTEDIAAAQTTNQELKAKVMTLEQEKSDANFELMEVRAALAAVDAKRVHLEKVAEEHSARIDDLRGTVATQEKLLAEAAAVAERVKRLEHEAVVAHQQLDAKQLSLDEAHADLEHERSTVLRLKTDLKDMASELVSHQQQLRTQQAVSNALQDVIGQNEDTITQLQVQNA